MNRRVLERHLRGAGCVLHHHGANHDMWRNPVTGGQSTLPRHNNIKYPTALGICKKLRVPPPPGR